VAGHLRSIDNDETDLRDKWDKAIAGAQAWLRSVKQ
jgi:hypothetical protein